METKLDIKNPAYIRRVKVIISPIFFKDIHIWGSPFKLCVYALVDVMLIMMSLSVEIQCNSDMSYFTGLGFIFFVKLLTEVAELLR
ncbi:hypothetical protein [Fictibacillus enclensis]|uniref:hypothetical protein n=1 Tax=Fictibacillus enclensis TaxID=1017270 RepID=UPI0024BF76F2|nr:hypothetical protein [Fictibacillus enclensis]WHY71857.1 hypothetical protein QNH15_23165 [Fictibacillus enclensis]